MGQTMAEWLHILDWLNRAIEADYFYQDKYDEPLSYYHNELVKAAKSLTETYRKNFL